MIASSGRICPGGTLWSLQSIWVTPQVDQEKLREELFPEYARQKRTEREGAERLQAEADLAEAKKLWAIIAQRRNPNFEWGGEAYKALPDRPGSRSENVSLYSGTETLAGSQDWRLINALRSGLLLAWAIKKEEGLPVP